MIKLNKTQARKAYDAGETVYVIACKMMPFTMYASEYPANKAELVVKSTFQEDAEFDAVVRNYEWYNCNYECGYYAAFYLK